MSERNFHPNLLHFTAQIVSAYASHHALTAADLSKLIAAIYGGLASSHPPAPEVVAAQSVALMQTSMFDDYLICLEDGRKLKMLKRHLQICYNLTPDQYRQKWGLPADYPMVAPGYAAIRAILAKEHGLGRKPQRSPALPSLPR